MKVRFLVLLSLICFSKYLLSMTPDSEQNDEKAQSTGSVNTCANLNCEENTNLKTCSRCKKVRYCSEACQKEDWQRGHKQKCHLHVKESNQASSPGTPASEFVQSLISACEKDKTLGIKGYPETIDDEMTKELMQIIQVGLGNKRVAFFSMMPGLEEIEMMNLARDPLKFARSRGALQKSYQDEKGFKTVIVYRPEHEAIANYFIALKRNDNRVPQNISNVILEGILLSYQRDNIKAYIQTLLDDKNIKRSLLKQLDLRLNFSDEDLETVFSIRYQQALEYAQKQYAL